MGEPAVSPAALLKLMSWLSPAFPVGAFAYSHGLEQAIHDGLIRDRATLVEWLSDLVERGSGWNDAVLLAEAWRVASVGGDCADIAELAEALAGSKERHIETTLQGAAFVEAAAAWEAPFPLTGEGKRESCTSGVPMMAPSEMPTSTAREGRGDMLAYPYPVAIGATAATHGISLGQTLTAFLHAFASNLIQAAVRLVPLGQRDGVAALAALEPSILAVAARAEKSTLDDLGACTVISDIMSMKHEVLYSRVFRS